ncbi:MAG: formylglycine-generating enzyme family protein, partial [Candidatus Sericytochromatia bacterium]|nr:formylglycine-generating enzyme family protein [Candidatus Tanganyikabacteria bacterium]
SGPVSRNQGPAPGAPPGQAANAGGGRRGRRSRSGGQVKCGDRFRGRRRVRRPYPGSPWCCGSTTHPVGQKQANSWGLYDMAGNVWEWCRDRDGSYRGGSVTDPADSTTGSYRVSRGGSWGYYAQFARAAYRLSRAPGARYHRLGFRLSRSSS